MRVFNDMTEIVLDAPNAYHTLSKFVERCFNAGSVSKSMIDELPQRLVGPYIISHNHLHQYLFSLCVCRGRKRYVSEGDGGAIKAPED